MVKRINIDNFEAIKSAITILNKGGIIAYPTDTLYGLGVDATNDKAIDKVNLLKGRSGPMSVMAANKNIALDWMDITTKQLEFIEPYLGGAQTLIVPVKNNIVSAKMLSGKGTLGIRIPNNDFCNELSLKFGKPIVSTSVNRSGKAPMNDPNKIELEFGSEIDLLIDSGTLLESKGSTIYKLKDNNITILRK
jgi:L-threonylcarbamoyladenylate synthase